MRKPISKQALRRAIERVHAEGHIQSDKPLGNVVDRLWQELEKRSYNSSRKKPISRETVRKAPAPEIAES